MREYQYKYSFTELTLTYSEIISKYLGATLVKKFSRVEFPGLETVTHGFKHKKFVLESLNIQDILAISCFGVPT